MTGNFYNLFVNIGSVGIYIFSKTKYGFSNGESYEICPLQFQVFEQNGCCK